VFPEGPCSGRSHRSPSASEQARQNTSGPPPHFIPGTNAIELNAFAITFADRMPVRNNLTEDAAYTVNLTNPCDPAMESQHSMMVIGIVDNTRSHTAVVVDDDGWERATKPLMPQRTTIVVICFA